MKQAFLLSLILFLNSTNLVSASEEAFVAGVRFTRGNKDFYISYQNRESSYNQDRQADKISFKLDTENLFPHRQEVSAYSGYRNIEGFENKNGKSDVQFASLVVGLGVLAAGATAFTVQSLINAIN